MLPSSHSVPIQTTGTSPAGRLTLHFSEFIEASKKLETSYKSLQTEVAELREELEIRNRQLETSARNALSAQKTLQSVLNALPCGVLVRNRSNRKLIWANPEFYRLVGKRVNDGKPVLPESLENLSIEPNRIEEHEFLDEESGRWLSVLVTDFEDAAVGSTVNEILIIRDISEQKALDLKRESSRNIVALEQMATVLAHEIRNPLASMELFADLLAGASEDRRFQNWTTHIKAGVRQLSATVNNVISFYARTELLLEPLELNTVVVETTSFLQPLAEQHGITLDVSGSIVAHVLGSTSALQQVIMNVCCNALQHTQRGGKISLKITNPGPGESDCCHLSIRDTGRGIRPEDLPKIFDAGFSRCGSHPGLGLSVCKRIIEKHNGTISVNSQLGIGTTVLISIPKI